MLMNSLIQNINKKGDGIMQNKPVNIQLVSDGDGLVIVIVNGKPNEMTYYCEYHLNNALEKLLEKYLVKYYFEGTKETE